MGKTRKNYKNNIGGKVIASGGYGCVFNPALKCQGSSKRDKNKISKLMTDKHATQEYEEIIKIKEKLDSIPHYEDYFLLNDVTICRPDKLTKTDLSDFDDKCSALPKDEITKQNINDKLNQVMSLNMPNGGAPVDDFIYANGSFQKMYEVHSQLVKLLKNGIVPMNELNIYHCDIKDSNVLVDQGSDSLKTRLIDWGLSVEYEASETTPFPKNWRNRPLQFNVPFSVIIFTDSFVEKYSQYLKDGGATDKISLKPFVIDYLNFWMKDRGAGHYKFINEILYKLYSNDLSSVSEKSKPAYIETQFTMPIITDYITNVLVHYTRFKDNGDINLREYLNEVFIKIVDIYGFINCYYPILEMLSNNYFSLNKEKLKLFSKITSLYKKYLYTPRHQPYNMNELLNHLKEIGNLIYIIIHGKKKTTTNSSNLARGLKTRKQKSSRSNKSNIFRRKPFVKRFKHPIMLGLK
jgi:serine/threonine protein kinase